MTANGSHHIGSVHQLRAGVATTVRHDGDRTPCVWRRCSRRGLRLEYATLGWNVVSIVVTVIAAVLARSVALAGFSLDSGVEIFASLVVVGELTGATDEASQHRGGAAHRLRVLALAVYLVGQAIVTLVPACIPIRRRSASGGSRRPRSRARPSPTASRWRGRALDHRVLQTEAKVTVVDGVLATATLTGPSLNAAFGWWWADIRGGCRHRLLRPPRGRHLCAR